MINAWDDTSLEEFLCRLSHNELRECAVVSHRWSAVIAPRTRTPWRAALQFACPGLRWAGRDVAANKCATGSEEVVACWDGFSVTLPPDMSHPGQLWALPIRPWLSSTEVPSPSLGFPSGLRRMTDGVDYAAATRLLSRWYDLDGGVLPICPFCAGVAYYSGPSFTVEFLETGWRPFLLCEASHDTAANRTQSKASTSLLRTTWANMGLDLAAAPPVALQLRALGEAGLSLPHQVELIESHYGLWRSNGIMLDCLVSLSQCCSDRLHVGGKSMRELGVAAYFCDQTGKYAMTSRTRVGRYLDDQPAIAPRAHIFGVATASPSGSWVPAGCLVEAGAVVNDGPEKCPFCGSLGQPLKGSMVACRHDAGDGSWELMPLNGALWVCAQQRHLYGWRARRGGAPVCDP